MPAKPAPASDSPFLGLGLPVRVAPFAVVAVLAEASLALPPGPQSQAAVMASALLLAAVAAAFLLPWPRLPPWMPVVVPLGYTGSVLALGLAAGVTSGVGAVILIPLVWTALFHRRWESACVVLAVVSVEVVISVAPVPAGGAVIARRVLLWAALGVLISVATHGLRDRIARSQAERDRLQERLREFSVLEDRERIASELRDHVVNRIFAAGLTMQGRGHAHRGRPRAPQPRDGGRRTRPCGPDAQRRDLRPSAPAAAWRPALGGPRPLPPAFAATRVPIQPGRGRPAPASPVRDARVLRETLALIEPDIVPSLIEITVEDQACLLAVAGASAENPAAEHLTEEAAPRYRGLLGRATATGAHIDIEAVGGSIRLTWHVPVHRRDQPDVQV